MHSLQIDPQCCAENEGPAMEAIRPMLQAVMSFPTIRAARVWRKWTSSLAIQGN